MRQQQNRRSKSRGNQNRKLQNPLSRVFDSSGPGIKVRGNAQHIYEKYMALARDAQTSGDYVVYENFAQHAEHYKRIIVEATPVPSPEETTEQDGVEENQPQVQSEKSEAIRKRPRKAFIPDFIAEPQVMQENQNEEATTSKTVKRPRTIRKNKEVNNEN